MRIRRKKSESGEEHGGNFLCSFCIGVVWVRKSNISLALSENRRPLLKQNEIRYIEEDRTFRNSVWDRFYVGIKLS